MSFAYALSAMACALVGLLIAVGAGSLIDKDNSRLGRASLLALALIIGAVGLGYLAGAS